jgi:polyisoprenyl-teichoic acid--peptidoglycan teichoic acid transferase
VRRVRRLPRLFMSLTKKFLIGGLTIVFVSAAATTSSALLFFETTVNKFTNVNVGRELTPEYRGKPQTIMIAGSDRRHGDKKLGLKPRSDTIILMRVDPDKGVALLSLPRDLKVSIPGHGTDKINVAYTLGGPRLTIRTVKQLTGLEINHYIDVNFRGFRQAIDTIGCVYVDVDRRYFNDNSGLGYGQQYAAINVRPGYQKMCGKRALEYVRYRHTDTDISRSARQQDFTRHVRQQLSATKLFDRTGKLIDIFADNTASDIRSAGALRRLLTLGLAARDAPIKQVRFHGRLGESYVYANQLQIKKAVDEFLNVSAGKGPLSRQRKEAPNARGKRRKKRAKVRLMDGTVSGREQAALADKDVGFPVYYPRKLVPGSSYPDAPRTYRIKPQGGKKRVGAYRMVIFTGFIGEYYGVQGLKWRNPPILEKPSETRRIGGREYLLFYNGDRLRLVGWRTKRASYWVSNTLLQSLSQGEMLGVARSLRKAG